MEKQKILAVDSRGRCNLSKVRTQSWERYIVTEYPDGTLVLTPAAVVSMAPLPQEAAA